MSRLIRFSMQNPVVVMLVIAMIIGGGLLSVQQMNIEQFPNVDIPYLTVVIPYPGASAEQAMNDIGKPLEAQLRNIKGVKNIYSEGNPNVYYATLEMEMDVKLDEAEREVRDALQRVQLPEEVKQPQFYRQSPSGNPAVYSIGVYAEKEELAKVQKHVEEWLLPSLEAIEGVSEIKLTGAEGKKVYVRLIPDALKKHHLTMDQVKQAIIANNLSVPTGEIAFADRRFPIRVNQKLESIEELKQIELPVVKQDLSGLDKAFHSIGDGMNSMGGHLQELGKGMGQLGQVQGWQQQQIHLLAAIQQLAGQQMQDQLRLQQLLAQRQTEPEAVPEEEIQALQQKIRQQEQTLQQLERQFQQLGQKVSQAGASLSQSHPQSPASPSGNKTTASISAEAKIETLKLGDIAEITYETDDAATLSRVNGKPAVILEVIPETGTNVVSIVEQVEKVLSNHPLPEGYQVEVLRDQSTQIEASVHGMLHEALLGALMAVAVTLLFLRNLRSTLIAVISIPLSVLTSLIVLRYLGYTLNLLTLSGIAVAVGRVVDDSIVVIENIFRRVSLSRERDAELVAQSTQEVANAITSSTITTVAVFLPMGFVSGIVGKFFAPLAWTVVISLLFSLLVAVTVVPLFSRLFLLNLKPEEPRVNALQRIYRRVLRWSLHHRLATLSLAFLLLMASVGLMVPRLGFNFLPQEKVLDYAVEVRMPTGTTIKKLDQVTRKVEETLLSKEGMQWVAATVSGKNDYAAIAFKVSEDVPEAEIPALIQSLRQEFGGLKEAQSVTVTEIGGLVGGQANEFVLVVNGPDIEAIRHASDQMLHALKAVPGLADLDTSLKAEIPEVELVLDEDALARHGLNPGMVGMNLRTLIQGEAVTQLSLDGQDTDVMLGIQRKPVSGIEQLGSQEIPNMLGEAVKLDQIGQLKETRSVRSVMRLNQREYAMIQGLITDSNTGKVLEEAKERLEGLKLPDGVSWYFEGASKAMSDGFKNMGIALMLSILLVYVVMAAAFGEALVPFVILFAIPFSVIGALAGLFFLQEPIGMPAMVGLLMLNGIVVTNAIVLLDRVKKNRLQGMAVEEALEEAGMTRLRPILMTAIATIGALTPLLFSTSGGLLSRSLAAVVVGGLTTSTLLTLVIVPVLYHLFLGRKPASSVNQTVAGEM